MIKTNKKGFTLVELIIVIAVIAVLAGVLIPTFSHVIKKARINADIQLTVDLNKKLTIGLSEKSINKNDTCYEAISCAKEAGFTTSLISKSNYSIAWEKTTGHFVLIDEEKGKVIYSQDDENQEYTINSNEDKSNYYIIRTNIDDEAFIAPNYYSIYCGDNFNSKYLTLNGVNFDAGFETNIEQINYINTTNNKKDIMIRTNGGILNIDSNLDTITHYGFSTIVNVNDVSIGTYKEAGVTARVFYNDNEGKIELINNSKIFCYMNKSNDENADLENITKSNESIVYTYVNSNEEVACGFGADKELTVYDQKVSILFCGNHSDNYEVVTTENVEYCICKCCGGYSKYIDGDLVYLEESDPNKDGEIQSPDIIYYESHLHEHEYSNEWIYDDTYHWHGATCEHLGLRSDFGAHDQDGENGCCSVCGYVPDKKIYVDSNDTELFKSAINSIDEGGIINVTTTLTLTSEVIVNKSLTIEGKQNITNPELIKTTSGVRRIDEIDEAYTTKIFIFRDVDVEIFEERYLYFLDKNIYITGERDINIESDVNFDLNGYILYLNGKQIILRYSVELNIYDNTYCYDTSQDQLTNRENMGAIWTNNTLITNNDHGVAYIYGGYYHVSGKYFADSGRGRIVLFNGLYNSECEYWDNRECYENRSLFFHMFGGYFYNCIPEDEYTSYVYYGRRLSDDKSTIIADEEKGYHVAVKLSYGLYVEIFRSLSEAIQFTSNFNYSLDIILLDNINEKITLVGSSNSACIFLNGYTLDGCITNYNDGHLWIYSYNANDFSVKAKINNYGGYYSLYILKPTEYIALNESE